MTNARDRRRERRKLEREAIAAKETSTEDMEKELAQGEMVEKQLLEVEVINMPNLPFGGAKSWEELDDYLDARDLADSTRQATFEFERLVENVLDDREASLSDKSSMITELASGLPDRVESAEEETTEGEKNLLEKFIDVIKTKDSDEFIFKPFPNFHAARVKNPGAFISGSFRTKRLPNGIMLVMGKLNDGKGAMETQTYRFPKNKFTSAEAKAWLKEHEISYISFEAAKESKSLFKVYKDKSGSHRWLGFVTNKWRDRDSASAPEKGGEILSEAAHIDMARWANEKPAKRMPFLRAWHSPDHQCKSKADFYEYHNGFVIASGQLTENEAKALEKVSELYDLGMSHGMYIRDGWRNKEDSTVLDKYRTFEVSHLPLEHAANAWTDFLTAGEEKSMDTEKRQYLEQLMGEEFIAEVLENANEKAAILESEGIESKAKKPKEEPTPEIQPEPQIPEPPDFKGLAESIIEAIGMK
jgi:hypothetical protein